MEIKADTIQAKIIVDALRSQVDVVRDCCFGDDDWRNDLEKSYGMPLEFYIYCLEGMIGEINGGSGVNLTQGGLRRLIQSDVASAVKAAIAEALVARPPENLERTSITEVAQRTTTVERSTPKVIAAGQTDKAELLRILESGRKLTPAQRKLLGMKRCSRCKTIKEFAHFKESYYADGYFAWCMECDSQPRIAAPKITTSAERDNRTYKELILAVLEDAGRAMRAAEIQAVIQEKWPTPDLSPSTVGGELRKLVSDTKVEQLDRGLYISVNVASEEEDDDNPRAGLIKCNQCIGRFSLRDLPEHKRTRHPVSEAMECPTVERER